jgi:hypothetical protein
MKHVLLVSALVMALALPGAAISSSNEASGQLSAKRGTFAINFTVYRQNGKPKRVGNLSWENAEVTCETGGPISIDGDGFGDAESGPNGRAKVKHKKFSKTYPGTSPGGGITSQKFKGKFKEQNTRVEGTLRVKGDFPDQGGTNCDTGKISYVAE